MMASRRTLERREHWFELTYVVEGPPEGLGVNPVCGQIGVRERVNQSLPLFGIPKVTVGQIFLADELSSSTAKEKGSQRSMNIAL